MPEYTGLRTACELRCKEWRKRVLRGIQSQSACGQDMRGGREEDKGAARAMSRPLFGGSSQRRVWFLDVTGLAIGRVFQKLRGSR